MKLGDGVEAAIHCTTLLAGVGPSAVMPAKALAEFHGVSPSYLVKHLKLMVGAGILESVPGPSGGYRLARAVDAISLLDIVLAVEGPAPAFRCQEIRQKGPCPVDASAYARPCGINTAMLKAEQAYRDVLAKTRISDLLHEFLETSDQRIVQRGHDFVEQNIRAQNSQS